MLNPDDLDPPKPKEKRRDLQPMSVEELEDYIASLQAEIARADETIARKKAHHDGIEALFGKKD